MATVGASSFDLKAPLYFAWQITNECDLACLHCIEESGPGKAFKDELDREQVFRILEEVCALEIPYLAFSGGEPLLHPHFFEMAEYVCRRGVQLKVETNGQRLSPDVCARLRTIGVKSLQVSLDGATPESYGKLRIRGKFEKVMDGLKNLASVGIPIELNFSPTRFNAGEVGRAVDLAAQLGASAFFTGKTMYTGNAVKAWGKISPSEEQYEVYFKTIKDKAAEYEGRLRVCYHEMGLLEELRCRLEHPAALLIVLPNGLVKLINALPFVCGDLKEQSVAEVWSRFRTAWRDPRVSKFVDAMAMRPELTSELHEWVRL